jgi:hypothetical protein
MSHSDLDVPTSRPPAPPLISAGAENTSPHHFAQIIVEQRRINMGQDLKFEEDPFNAQLNGLMKSEEYRVAIGKINEVTIRS